MIFRFILITVFATLVSGCSDPKAANEKNFKAAIQNYLDTAYPKCYVATNFPTTTEYDVDRTTVKLRALVKVGLLSESVGSREIITHFGNGGKKSIPTPSFDLTEEGRKFYKADVRGELSNRKIGGFCLGKAIVKNITQFSEPADMFGHRISRVNYTYEVSGLPAWAKSPEIISVIYELKADVESDKTPIKRLDTLLLTNNGWVHEKLFKK